MTYPRIFATLLLIVILVATTVPVQAAGLTPEWTDCVMLSKPQITGPADGAVLVKDPLTGEVHEMLSWSALTGVSLYYYQIFSSPSGMEVTTGNAQANTAPISLEIGTYTWHVAGIDQNPGCNLVGEWSNTYTFEIKDNDVIPPGNFQATDGTYPDRVVLTWNLDLQAGSYLPDWFSVYRKPVVSDGIEEIAHHLGPDTRTFTDLAQLTNERYSYWVVAGNDTYGEQPSGWDGGYASKCVPVGTPVLKDPADGAAFYLDPIAGVMDNYTWSRPVGVYAYQVQTFDADASNAIPLFDNTADGVSFQIPVTSTGSYRWRVRALSPVDACAAGDWTGYRAFTVAQTFLYPVTNFTASDGIFPDRVRLTWDVNSSLGAVAVEPGWFTIYRADSPTGAKTEIAWIAYGQIQRYEDNTVQPGKKYTYWVVADDLVQSASWSAPDEGWSRAGIELGFTLFLPSVRH